MTPTGPVRGSLGNSRSDYIDMDVIRPWWAFSNLVNKAWWIAAALLGVIFASASLYAIFIPSTVIGLTSVMSALSLTILLGLGFFEKVRQSGTLSKGIQLTANAIRSYVIEVLCLVVMAMLYPTAIFHKDPKKSLQLGQRPILLVHGYFHNSSAWQYVKWRLQHANLGPIYTINLGNPLTLKSIAEYASLVQNKVDFIVKETGCDKVVLAGHSMGGIICAEAATHLDKDHHIDLVITLAAPLRGTRIAYLGIGKCAREMVYSKTNDFLNDLISRIKKYAGNFHCFGSMVDLIVIPNTSAFVEGTDKSLFQDHGHLSYLGSDAVIDRMITIIRACK